MRNIIVGTAGHIDHGKSTLVEALTGTNPDRLEEERRRGITLDLGFAFLEASGVSFGFVDVPGHERFVRNMLAGAGGFDLVLLVVAADESIKPQTREHFEICRLLGIPRGLIVVTKVDLIDSGTLDLVRLEIEEFVRGSFLQGAPVVAFSARTGQGLDDLRAALIQIAAELPARSSSGYFRLPIDRSFAMRGFGTVVTGTLISGEVAPEDEVQLFPSRRVIRVRGVQTGGKPVSRAAAGQRTALNLAGVSHEEIDRGMVLAAPNRFEATARFDVRITQLSSARSLRHRARVHFHQGTAEAVAEVYLLDQAEVPPGGSAFAQLRLVDPILLFPGDRFILRQFSPLLTIGGGVILDSLASRHRLKDTGAVRRLETFEQNMDGPPQSRLETLSMLISSYSDAATAGELIKRTGWSESEIHSCLKTLAEAGRIRTISAQPPTVASLELMTASAARVLAQVEHFHHENPLIEAISKEDLRMRSTSALHPEVFRAVLDDLAATGKLSVSKDCVKRANRSVHLLPEEARAKQQIEREFARAGLTAPSVNQVLTALPVEARRAQKLLQLLLSERTLVRVNGDLVFHREALEQLRAKLYEYRQSHSNRLEITVFKDLAGISRKYAIPLLEYFDREHVTRRMGDYRVIL